MLFSCYRKCCDVHKVVACRSKAQPAANALKSRSAWSTRLLMHTMNTLESQQCTWGTGRCIQSMSQQMARADIILSMLHMCNVGGGKAGCGTPMHPHQAHFNTLSITSEQVCIVFRFCRAIKEAHMISRLQSVNSS